MTLTTIHVKTREEFISSLKLGRIIAMPAERVNHHCIRRIIGLPIGYPLEDHFLISSIMLRKVENNNRGSWNDLNNHRPIAIVEPPHCYIINWNEEGSISRGIANKVNATYEKRKEKEFCKIYGFRHKCKDRLKRALRNDLGTCRPMDSIGSYNYNADPQTIMKNLYDDRLSQYLNAKMIDVKSLRK